MKKVLLATTALIGFAGAAAAEISLSGYAEIGVSGGNGTLINDGTGSGATTDFTTQFHNDWQVNFNFSGETDGGLSFGGSVQLEENNSPSLINGVPRTDDEAFWVSGTFGKVTLGETKGALDWAVPDIYSGTSLTDDHSTHAGAYWNTGLDGVYDDQIARYEYSFGDWGVAVSAEMDDQADRAAGTQAAADPGYVQGDVNLAIGVKWSGQLGGADANAGIGYQDNGDVSTWALAGHAKWGNGFEVSLGYADFDSSATTTINDYIGNGVAVDSWAGIGVAYTTGALTVGANYGVYSATLAGVDDPSGFGLVANYDLGGGAVAMIGYGASSGSNGGVDYGAGNGKGDKTWSAGLGLSF